MNKHERLLADGMKRLRSKIKINPHYSARGKWVTDAVMDAEDFLRYNDIANEYFNPNQK